MSRHCLSAVLIICLAATLHAQPKPKKAPPPQRVPDGIKQIKDIDYAGDGHERHKLDLYVPENGEKRPLLIWIHGGGWKAGNKDRVPILWALEHGYALASINYRLTDIAKFPAQIHDCKGAIRFLRAHAAKFGYNATKIGVAGGSAGGHLVALIGTSGDVKELEGDIGGNLDQSSRVQAVLDLYGPTDFVTMVMQPSTIDRTTADYPEALLIGARVQDAPDKARAASPATYITHDDPPVLIYQGDADPLVPFHQSISFHELLDKAGVPNELVLIKGGKHGGPEFGDDTARAKQLAFFDRYIKGQ
jgi:acetyl esterase/lipase